MNQTDLPISETQAKEQAATATIEKEEENLDDMPPTRNIRQRDLVDEKRLSEWCALVVGTGAVGHEIGRRLAALGFLEAVLVDFDTVAIENMSAQGFCPTDITHPKVHVVGGEMSAIFPDMTIRVLHERFSTKALSYLPKDKKIVVFCCVDTMSARKEIHEGDGFDCEDVHRLPHGGGIRQGYCGHRGLHVLLPGHVVCGL